MINSQKINSTFTISLDFELYWGVRDVLTLDQYRENILGVREAIPQMLALFQEYNIHATWATVGFLFFDNKEQLIQNLPAVVPNYTNTAYSPISYLKNIGADEKTDPFHFGKSLVELIASYPHQEIASHSFTHYYCLEEGQDGLSFESDLDRFVEVAGKNGFSTRSYVFPRNQKNSSYLPILLKKGITSYRGEEQNFIYRATQKKAADSKLKRMIRLLDSYINIVGHNTYKAETLNPTPPHNLPSSRFLRGYAPALSLLEPLKINRIKKSMLHAAKHNEMFHLWWHPHNFGKNIKNNISNLRAILEYFAELQEKYGMTSLTMAEVSDKLLSHESSR